jgi:hypothetical protein
MNYIFCAADSDFVHNFQFSACLWDKVRQTSHEVRGADN